MDIAIVGENSIKIKGKQVSFVVDPTKEVSKIASDAVILFDNGCNIDTSRVTDSRIVIAGPGEYEVGGAKVSGVKTPKGIFYKLSVDGVSIILGFAMDAKMEGFDECKIAVVKANNEFNEAFVTGLEPKITVLYGDKKAEAAKTLGAENVSIVPKVSTTKDKLPEKMEIVVLG